MEYSNAIRLSARSERNARRIPDQTVSSFSARRRLARRCWRRSERWRPGDDAVSTPNGRSEGQRLWLKVEVSVCVKG